MFTAQDVVYHLLIATSGGAQDGEHEAIRGAVVHGVREVLSVRDWLWHTRTGTITTNEVATTATAITVDSDTITVASATGFEVGRLAYIDPGYFDGTTRIKSKNGNSIVLDRVAKKTMPVGATVRVLAQTYYDLPAELRDIDALVSDVVGTLHCFVTPQEWQRLETVSNGAGEPYYYTIMRSDVYPDRYQIRFVGVPTGGTTLHYTYRYTPPMIRFMGYEPQSRQGVATISAGTSTATITGHAFDGSIVDRCIRFGTVNQDADPSGALNRFSFERTIKGYSLSSGTATLTLDAATPSGLLEVAGIRFAISDILDCSPQMFTAILSASEMWYARLAGRSAKEVVALFNRDLRLAMENDVVSPLAGRPASFRFATPRSMGWKSAQLPDNV